MTDETLKMMREDKIRENIGQIVEELRETNQLLSKISMKLYYIEKKMK
jgi:hypothetical protein